MHLAAYNGREGAMKLLVSWGVDTTINNDVRLDISHIMKAWIVHHLSIINEPSAIAGWNDGKR